VLLCYSIVCPSGRSIIAFPKMDGSPSQESSKVCQRARFLIERRVLVNVLLNQALIYTPARCAADLHRC
jgi:hypothetical protein